MAVEVGGNLRRLGVHRLLAAVFLLASLNCGAPEPDFAPSTANDVTGTTATFLNRPIDLGPYLSGFRFHTLRPSYDADSLFFIEEDEQGRWLGSIPLDGSQSLTQGSRLSAEDWSNRTVWDIVFHHSSNSILIWADENNDERMNVFRLERSTGQLAPLTDVPYVYGYGIDPTGEQLGYVARYGEAPSFLSCFHILQMATGLDTQIVCDPAGHQMTWTNVSWRPDGQRVVLTVQGGGRSLANLGYVDLEPAEPALEMLLPERRRSSLLVLEKWLNEDQVAFISDETGFLNLFVLDITSGQINQLTDFEQNVSELRLLEINSAGFIAAVIQRPTDAELQIVNIASGEVVARQILDGTVWLRDVVENRGILVMTSMTTPLQLLEFVVDPVSFRIQVETAVELPTELAESITSCQVERVEIPTFDLDPSTARPRYLHAFLLTPENPPPTDQWLVRIQSFYGGENVFDLESHLLCEAGISTLSPAPRGSRGFGAEFAAMNDGDLGGDEIVDVIFSARWLSEEYGLEPEQIGVFGSSHGGYATMRLMTFPPLTNGRRASFDFGFGVSHAGFSNILTYFESGNVPDWVMLEAGNPLTQGERLLDRSPISHVNLLSAPMLLTHGENDSRVPVGESRQFVRVVEDAGAGELLTYVEFPNMGHRITGFSNRLTYYQTLLEFLDSIARGNLHP